MIAFVFFNVAVELTLNSFVLHYSRKSTSRSNDRLKTEVSSLSQKNQTMVTSHLSGGTVEASENDAEFAGIEYTRNADGDIKPT